MNKVKFPLPNDENLMLEMTQVEVLPHSPQKHVRSPWATQLVMAIALLLCFAFIIAIVFPGVLYIVCAVFVIVYLQEMKVQINMDSC